MSWLLANLTSEHHPNSAALAARDGTASPVARRVPSRPDGGTPPALTALRWSTVASSQANQGSQRGESAVAFGASAASWHQSPDQSQHRDLVPLRESAE